MTLNTLKTSFQSSCYELSLPDKPPIRDILLPTPILCSADIWSKNSRSGVVGVSDGPVKSWQNSMNQPTRCSKLLTWEANKIADRKIYKIYEIYKIYKILCNIQINVIQIAQVLNGYLVKTFDNIVSHECLKTVFVVTQLKLNFKKEPQLLQSKI